MSDFGQAAPREGGRRRETRGCSYLGIPVDSKEAEREEM